MLPSDMAPGNRTSPTGLADAACVRNATSPARSPPPPGPFPLPRSGQQGPDHRGHPLVEQPSRGRSGKRQQGASAAGGGSRNSVSRPRYRRATARLSRRSARSPHCARPACRPSRPGPSAPGRRGRYAAPGSAYPLAGSGSAHRARGGGRSPACAPAGCRWRARPPRAPRGRCPAGRGSRRWCPRPGPSRAPRRPPGPRRAPRPAVEQPLIVEPVEVVDPGQELLRVDPRLLRSNGHFTCWLYQDISQWSWRRR